MSKIHLVFSHWLLQGFKMDARWKLLFFVAGFLVPKIICQETVLQTCIDTGVRENAFNLTCEVHHVIVDVDYTAGADNCFQKRCSGDSRDLMTNLRDCYWTQACNLFIPKDRITESEESSCVKTRIRYLNVSRYRCFNNTAGTLYDICENNPELRNVESGIIRSHRDYPLNYNLTQDCSLSVAAREQTLRFTVLRLDKSETDNLLVIGQAEQVLAAHAHNSHVIQLPGPATEVTFKFEVHSNSKFGRGFIICFKFYPSSQRPVQDVCKDITADGYPKTLRRRRLKDKSGRKKKKKGKKERKGKKRKKGRKTDKSKKDKRSKRKRKERKRKLRQIKTRLAPQSESSV